MSPVFLLVKYVMVHSLTEVKKLMAGKIQQLLHRIKGNKVSLCIKLEKKKISLQKTQSTKSYTPVDL